MGSMGIMHWLVVLGVLILLFGGKRLRNLGEDAGEAIKGFRRGIRDATAEEKPELIDNKDKEKNQST